MNGPVSNFQLTTLLFEGCRVGGGDLYNSDTMSDVSVVFLALCEFIDLNGRQDERQETNQGRT